MNVKTVYIEITNKCNLNCATCYNRSGLNREHRELSCADIEGIIRIFAPYGLKRVLLSGGEPTLHTEFDSILDLPEKYPDISFGIVTNGTNINRKLIDIINTRDNFKLQISLDGSCEDSNAKTRGAGNFSKTVEFARQIHRDTNKPLLKMVISQNNIDDVEAFCELSFSLGFIPEFAFIFKSGNGESEWKNKALSPMQKLKVLKLIERINREQGEDIFLPLCTSGCPIPSGKHEFSLCVKVDGSIQPCQSLYDDRFTVGNVLAFDADAFELNMERIADVAKKRAESDYNCDKCMIKNACGRGCMAEAVNLHGDPLANDGNCEYRKMQFLNMNLKGAMMSDEK